MEAKDALVVWYSRSGATERVARAIAEGLGCDLEQIVDRRDRGGLLGFMATARDAMTGSPADIEEPENAPSERQLVVIGTPVWTFTVSSPVRAYLSRQRGRLPRVAFFLTAMGIGAQRTFGAMAELCGKDAVATLALRRRHVVKGRQAERVAEFVGRLQSACD